MQLHAKEIVPRAIILRALHWSMQWGRYVSPRVKISPAAVEDEDDVDHVLFVQRRVTHTEFVREGETVKSDFCLPVQKWLCERISELRRQFGEKGIRFVLHNNAPAHFVMILQHLLANRGMVQVTTHLNHQPSRQLPFFILYPGNDPPRKQVSRLG
jgi:hypothetical protein